MCMLRILIGMFAGAMAGDETVSLLQHSLDIEQAAVHADNATNHNQANVQSNCKKWCFNVLLRKACDTTSSDYSSAQCDLQKEDPLTVCKWKKCADCGECESYGTIKYIGERKKSYGLCQGDCDKDSDCKSGLKCFHRHKGKPVNVPGCWGTAEDKPNSDFCYDPSVKEVVPAPTPSPTEGPVCKDWCFNLLKRQSCDTTSDSYDEAKCDLQTEDPSDVCKWENCAECGECESYGTIKYIGEKEKSYGLCQGDCDKDSDCKSGLKCFQRHKGRPVNVPGCWGTAEDKPNADFCYDPSVKETQYVGENAAPYGMCQGDCDSDSDCEGDLKCLQRHNGKPALVPGCFGTPDSTYKNTDYCYQGS